MTEKRFTITQDFEEHHRQIRDNGHIIMGCFFEPQAEVIVDLLNELNNENKQLKSINQDHKDHLADFYADYDRLEKENEQLKQQLNIFEKFLEGNDLDIEWEEFCGVDECAFENPDFSCKECIHLKGDVE